MKGPGGRQGTEGTEESGVTRCMRAEEGTGRTKLPKGEEAKQKPGDVKIKNVDERCGKVKGSKKKVEFLQRSI